MKNVTITQQEAWALDQLLRTLGFYTGEYRKDEATGEMFEVIDLGVMDSWAERHLLNFLSKTKPLVEAQEKLHKEVEAAEKKAGRDPSP